jgi:hypothetical protein
MPDGRKIAGGPGAQPAAARRLATVAGGNGGAEIAIISYALSWGLQPFTLTSVWNRKGIIKVAHLRVRLKGGCRRSKKWTRIARERHHAVFDAMHFVCESELPAEDLKTIRERLAKLQNAFEEADPQH